MIFSNNYSVAVSWIVARITNVDDNAGVLGLAVAKGCAGLDGQTKTFGLSLSLADLPGVDAAAKQTGSKNQSDFHSKFKFSYCYTKCTQTVWFYTVEGWSIINKVHSRYQTQWRMYNLFLNAPYHRIDRLKVASHCLNKVMSVIETNDRVFIKQLISTRYAIT